MANNCGYGIDIECSIENAGKARRVIAIINNEDPDYCVVRTWGVGWSDEEEKGDRFAVYIDGECPWTARYFWDPESTLAGRKVGDIIEGRVVVSIPFLCQMWDMSATGWEEELGCDVCGEFRCGNDGVLTYTDTLAATMLECAENSPWDEGYVTAVYQMLADGQYDEDEEMKERATALLQQPEVRELLEGADE